MIFQRARLFLPLWLLLAAPASSQGLPAATPESLGLSPTALEAIGPVLQQYVDEEKVAGMVAMVARRGQVAYFESFGLKDREAGIPMTRDALFRIFSMTKPLTSVAVLMLMEEGRLKLDDPVAAFIPAYAGVRVYSPPGGAAEGGHLARPVTLRDLLLHTSGLTYGTFGNTSVDSLYREADPLGQAASLAGLADALAGLPLVHQPGAAWTYGLSTDVLARVVEVVAEEPFEAFLKRRILDPLQMHDTGFYVPADKLSRFTALYASTDEGLHVIDAPATSRFAAPPAYARGASGLVSTVADYVRFAQMLLNGGHLGGVRLLREDTVRLMTSNHLPEALIPIRVGPFAFPGHGFGLGVGVLVAPEAAVHPGSKGLYWWVGAAHTYFWVDPEEELIGLLMTQFQPVGRYPLLQVFHRLTYDAILD